MDPTIVQTVVPILIALIITLGGRFSDLGRKTARKLKAAQADVETLDTRLRTLRRHVREHNEICPCDEEDLIQLVDYPKLETQHDDE